MNLKEFLEAVKTGLELPSVIAAAIAPLIGILLKMRNVSYTVTVDLVWFIPTLVLIMWLAVFVFPWLHPKLRMRRLSRHAPFYWKKIKSSIRRYHESNEAIEKQRADDHYKKYRVILMELIVRHREKLIEAVSKQRPGAMLAGAMGVGNFENVFSCGSLSAWQSKCGRDLDNGLDCFDAYPIFMQQNAFS